MARRLLPLLGLVAGSLGVVSSCAAEAERSPLEEAASPTSSSTSTTERSTTTTAPTTTMTAAPFDVFALRPPPPAADPSGLAQQLVAAETTIRDPAASIETLPAASLAHQVAYRQLGIHPEWDEAVLAAVPDHLRRTVELNAAARREFRAMHQRLPTTMPAWQIVPPAPVDVLMAAYQEAEATFGIPWQYLAAINLVETATGRIRGTSTAGAQGPMQFMPATWVAYGGGGDVNDTHDAILGAGRYLAANNGAHDIDHALFRYNHSDHYVRGVRLYAELIAEHPRAFLAFYHWGVWYITDHGDLYLPVGYSETTSVPVADYLAR